MSDSAVPTKSPKTFGDFDRPFPDEPSCKAYLSACHNYLTWVLYMAGQRGTVA